MLSEKDMFSIDTLVQRIVKIGPMDELFGEQAFEKQIRSSIQNTGKFLTVPFFLRRAASGLVLQLFFGADNLFLSPFG